MEHVRAHRPRIGAIRRRLVHDPALPHHHDAVRQFQDLVQVLARSVAPRCPALRAAMILARVSATAFTSSPKHGLATISSAHLPIQFPRQHTALHVAARQHADRSLWRRRPDRHTPAIIRAAPGFAIAGPHPASPAEPSPAPGRSWRRLRLSTTVIGGTQPLRSGSSGSTRTSCA